MPALTDHPVTRRFWELLGSIPDLVLLDVRIPGGGGAAVVEAVKKRQPDIKSLGFTVSTNAEDVRIPGGGGAAVVEEVKKRQPDIKSLGFTVSTNAEDVRRLFQAGVDGPLFGQLPSSSMEPWSSVPHLSPTTSKNSA